MDNMTKGYVDIMTLIGNPVLIVLILVITALLIMLYFKDKFIMQLIGSITGIKETLARLATLIETLISLERRK